MCMTLKPSRPSDMSSYLHYMLHIHWISCHDAATSELNCVTKFKKCRRAKIHGVTYVVTYVPTLLGGHLSMTLKLSCPSKKL